MSLTIGEVLGNAEYNLRNAYIPMQTAIGKEQLKNYNLLIDAGYSEDNDFDESFEEFNATNPEVADSI